MFKRGLLSLTGLTIISVATLAYIYYKSINETINDINWDELEF